MHKQYNNIVKELQSIVQEQKYNPQLDLRHKIEAARTVLNLSLTTKAEKYLRWSRHRFNTLGDKPTTLLARKLTPRPNNLALPRLLLQDGKLTQNPQLIIAEFSNFFSKLPQPIPHSSSG